MSVVRRRSGGGTVYHDLGNTNYCVLVPRQGFERRANADMVVRALRRLMVPAYVNERNDICVEKYKVSGSAFKLSNHRAYHHGTMLIEAKLCNLGVLHSGKDNIETKGVLSVSSAVRNLEDWSANINHESFVEAVADEFAATYKSGRKLVQRIDDSIARQNCEVGKEYEELKSWEWVYGQTPEFTHRLENRFGWGNLVAKIISKRGIIESLTLVPGSAESILRDECDELQGLMLGDRYGTIERTLEVLRGLRGQRRDDTMQQIVEWLFREM